MQRVNVVQGNRHFTVKSRITRDVLGTLKTRELVEVSGDSLGVICKGCCSKFATGLPHGAAELITVPQIAAVLIGP